MPSPDWVTAISTCVMALATVVMVVLTLVNISIYQSISQKDKEYKQQSKDLFEAIVIATLLSGPSSTGGISLAKEEFKKNYKGPTEIFRN